MLPQAFTERMKKMLGEEYSLFLKSYEENKNQSLRFNPLKGERESFLLEMPFQLSPVPWSKNGFYYEEGDRPGKHPYHEAGAYYIQEASAMAPAQALMALPGERILDLCAAPGGKSTQLAADMQGEGILICNEIHPARAKILSENIERMGVCNAIVTNHSPDELAERFPEYFDKILVDAPCSGEGMFRKNPEAAEEWSPENVEMCAARQDEILDQAAAVLCPGGRLVYSTCTFAPEENEGSVSRFIKRHPDFSLLPVKKYEGMGNGVSEWVNEPAAGIENTVRLWPHRLKGEGHFFALLQKEGEKPEQGIRHSQSHLTGKEGRAGKSCLTKEECREFTAFREEYIKRPLSGILVRFGEQLYLMPQDGPSLDRLKVLRPGLHLGTFKKNRFEPAHALALSLKKEEVKLFLELSAKEERTAAYLRGETISAEGEKGWRLILADGFSLGWGKAVSGIMKNHYPKGLRR